MSNVTDFTIDNASGQAVRLDIEACLKALQSCNSKNGSDLTSSQSVAGMWFLREDGNLLKIKGSGTNFTSVGNIDEPNLGLLPKAGGTMTGPLLIDDATSAATPALSFDGATNLGIFKKADNVMGFSSGGEEQVFIDANSLTISSKSNASKELRFSEKTDSATGGSVQYVGFKAPDTIAANVVWKLPDADTTVAGYALISDGSGNLSWGVAGAGAKGGGTDKIFWENDQTVTQSYEITNGKNAGSFGPIAIQSGATVTIRSGETWTVV